MEPITVIATIRARPGKESELETLLKGIVKPTHQEGGCLLYKLHRSQSNPRSFFTIEKWASPKDLDEHMKTPHVSAAVAKVAELVEYLDISPLIPYSEGNPKKEAF